MLSRFRKVIRHPARTQWPTRDALASHPGSGCKVTGHAVVLIGLGERWADETGGEDSCGRL